MKTKRFLLVEVLKPASLVGAGQQLLIGDQATLRSQDGRKVRVLSIEAYPADVIPTSPSGNAVSNTAAFQNATLNLITGGARQDLQGIPLPRLNAIEATGGTAPFTHDPLTFDQLDNIDWGKSYLQFSAAPAAAVVSYLFGVHYLVME